MFEQPIGFLNITVNIRMTVVRLKDGDLLVYNPIAPTGAARISHLEAPVFDAHNHSCIF